MLKAKLLIIVYGVVMLNCNFSNAQSDYRSGYVVSKEKDTVYGLINYGSNKTNALKCIFKKDETSEKQIFDPKDILGYRFTNSKYYISKKVKLKDEERLLFLEYLINGVFDVYFFRDDEGDYYYLGNDEGELRELKNYEKKFFKEGITYTTNSRDYVRTLKFSFKDSPNVVKKIDDLRLNHKSLIKITQDYHNEVCAGGEECIVYEKNVSKSEQGYGIIVGVNTLLPLIVNTDRYSSYLVNSEFKGLFPAFGAFYKINSPFLDERIFFYCEGTYQKANFTSTDTQVFFGDQFRKSEYSLDLNMVTLMAAVRYEFPKGKVKPVFEAGASYTFSLKSEYNHDVFAFNDDDSLNLVVNENNIQSFRIRSVNIGAGVKFNYFKSKEMCVMLEYQVGELENHDVFINNPTVGVFKFSTSFELSK